MVSTNHDDPDLERRLRSEAAFQNARVEAGTGGTEEARDKFYYLAERARARYHNAFGDVTDQRVLVVGCSEGGVTPLARRGAIVTGIDIADVAVERLNASIAREGLSDRAKAVVMNAEDVDFEPGSLDLIVCAGVLHHLDVEKAAASWAKALAPTGRVLMLEPMAWHPAVALYRLMTPSMRTPDEHPLTPKDIRLLEAHFGRVEVDGFVLTTLFSLPWSYLPNSDGLREKSLKFLERFDDLLLKRVPPLKYFCWTSVIEVSQPRP